MKKEEMIKRIKESEDLCLHFTDEEINQVISEKGLDKLITGEKYDVDFAHNLANAGYIVKNDGEYITSRSLHGKEAKLKPMSYTTEIVSTNCICTMTNIMEPYLNGYRYVSLTQKEIVECIAVYELLPSCE